MDVALKVSSTTTAASEVTKASQAEDQMRRLYQAKVSQFLSLSCITQWKSSSSFGGMPGTIKPQNLCHPDNLIVSVNMAIFRYFSSLLVVVAWVGGVASSRRRGKKISLLEDLPPPLWKSICWTNTLSVWGRHKQLSGGVGYGYSYPYYNSRPSV